VPLRLLFIASHLSKGQTLSAAIKGQYHSFSPKNNTLQKKSSTGGDYFQKLARIFRRKTVRETLNEG